MAAASAAPQPCCPPRGKRELLQLLWLLPSRVRLPPMPRTTIGRMGRGSSSGEVRRVGGSFRVSLCAAALLLAGGLCAKAQGYGSGDPIRGKPLAEAKCAACHGPDGNSPAAQAPKARMTGRLWLSSCPVFRDARPGSRFFYPQQSSPSQASRPSLTTSHRMASEATLSIHQALKTS